MSFSDYYFVVVTIVVLATGRIGFVACRVEESYDTFRDELTRDALSDDEAVRLRFVKSEEGIAVPEDPFYEDDGAGGGGGGGARRARRSVDQNQRNDVVQALNDIRRSVNSSDLQYMYWNSADEPMLNTWTRQCQYSAKVYVTAAARIIKMVTDKPPDFVAQLHESFGFPDLQRLLTSAYITKVSANGNFCPKLITNSTTTFDNSYLGVISLTYVTGFKVNTTQFTVGPPCTACLSGVYWCDAELCRADCSPAIPTCYCRPACLNCAGYNETTCKCNCLSGWGGPRCERNTTLTPTVPNCTTIAPSTYPWSTDSYISTITTPITSEYYSVSNSTALQTVTTEANQSTNSLFDENTTTTVQPTNETTNETTPFSPIEGFNETTTSFLNENMTTTAQPTNETTNETTSVFPINETTSALFNVTEQSTSTTASSIDSTLNTSITSPPIPPTILNNNPNGFYNYTQRLLDIENLLLRLLLMFQYYLTPTTTTTTTTSTATSTTSAQTSGVLGGNVSSGTTPVPANNFSSVAAEAGTMQANNSAVNTGNSSYTTTTPSPLTSQAQTNGDGTGTTKPPNTIIPTDLPNYLNSLDDLKNMILLILRALEARLAPAATTPSTQNSPQAATNATVSTGLLVNQTASAQYQTNPSNSSAAVTSPPFLNASSSSSSNISDNNTLTASTGPLPSSNVSTSPANGANTFPSTSSPSTLSDPYNPLLLNLLELLRRLEMFLQTQTSTTSNQNIGSTTPGTAAAATQAPPGGSNNTANGANTFPSTSSPLTLSDLYNPLLLNLLELLRRWGMFQQTSTTSNQSIGSTTPGTAAAATQAPPGDSNNTTGTSTTLGNESAANNNNTSSSHDQGNGSNATWTSPGPAEGGNNNSANSSTKSTNDLTPSNPANSSSSPSDGRPSPQPPLFFGSNSPGASTATTTTTNAGNTALGLSSDLYHDQIQQLLLNILKTLGNVLRPTTPDINRTTTSASNTTGSTLYRGNTPNANDSTQSPGAAGGAANYPVREFIIRIWDYGTSAATPRPRSSPKNLMMSLILLMGTILQLV